MPNRTAGGSGCGLNAFTRVEFQIAAVATNIAVSSTATNNFADVLLLCIVLSFSFLVFPFSILRVHGEARRGCVATAGPFITKARKYSKSSRRSPHELVGMCGQWSVFTGQWVEVST